MKRIIIFSALVFPELVTANECSALYKKEAEAIEKRYGHDTHVGGQFYVQYGQLRYWPGTKVKANIDNWAEDLLTAIEYGPFKYFARSDDPRKAWLESFQRSIKNRCSDLGRNDYEALRSMLKELLADGSLCPGNQILTPGFMGLRGNFTKVLSEAVDAGRFSELCKSYSVRNDTSRDVKETKLKPTHRKQSGSSDQ